jgi:lysophospholipase L1-like esterase
MITIRAWREVWGGGRSGRGGPVWGSVTLGMGDPVPHGGWRGWAALLAGSLAPPDRVELSNLALSGALIRDVAGDHLDQAVSLAPTHASVLVGMNDTLRGTFDLTVIAADLERIVATLERTGALVLTASLPDPGLLLRIPGSLRRPLARRAHAINGVLGRLAERYQVVHVDVAAHPAIYDKRMWGVDRLHPSERGHRLLARLFAARLAELGMPLHAMPDPEPHYGVKITIMAVLYATGWAAVVALGASWYQLLAAVYLAAVFGQLAFVGHEAGHRQIFRSRRANDSAGLVLGNLLIGLSLAGGPASTTGTTRIPTSSARIPT